MSLKLLLKKFHARRRELCLSQEDVGKRAGLSQIAYHRIETGTRRPTPLDILTIARILGIDLDTVEGVEPGFIDAIKRLGGEAGEPA